MAAAGGNLLASGMSFINPTRILTAVLLVAWAYAWAAPAVAQSPESRAQPYRYSPAPAWVDVARVAMEGPPVEDGHSDYLLVDNQVRLSAITEHYFRASERLTTQEAVDRAAQISIEVDPEHELALLHGVTVLRDGRAIDKLADARRSLLNREEDLENRLLNGRITLHLLLQDVRVGDVLDYSYTMQRRDPYGETGYSDWFSTQWGEPVRRYRLRVLHPPNRTLLVRNHGKIGEPVKNTAGPLHELLWQANDIAALTDEASRPSWFFITPRIEITEFKDWSALREWARPLYRVNGKDDAALRALIADVKSQRDDKARVLKALRFVQDDIRYTGIEIGAGAMRPTQPSAVLARRYGDCKDKTLLLVTILRELGIGAWPALVHSTHGRGVIERAPGPGAFDHVVAKVRLGDKDYWLDATASGQGGDLDTLVQADFGPALVLDDSRVGLQLIPPRQAAKPTHSVIETYDLREGREKTAKFSVQTVYTEQEADGMRARMRRQTAAALSKEFLDYYRKTYAGVRMIKPISVKDDRARNEFQLNETYEIDQPFEKEGKSEWTFSLEAYLVSERSKKPEQAERTTPLARSFPMHVRHQIIAYLPDRWDIEPEVVKIDDPAFEYRSEVKFGEGRLDLTYDLRSASDHVPAARMKEYAAQLSRVHDDAFFTLTDTDTPSKPDAVAKPAAPPPAFWAGYLMWFAALGGIAAGAIVARALARIGGRLPTAHVDAPVGVDGWLLAPGVLACLLPLIAGTQLAIVLQDFGSPAGFAALGTFQQKLHSVQVLLLSALMVVALASVGRLWKRSPSFPATFGAAVVLVVGLVICDVYLSWHDGAFNVSGLEPLLAPLVIAAFCGLCGGYLRWSQRVRATFTAE
jgi:transglutaminase-like putative cysteine protease